MKTRNSTIVLIAMVLAAAAQLLRAADRTERFDGMPRQSEVRVEGTSTAHDWTVKSPTISGNISFKIDVPADTSTAAVKEAIVANPSAEADVSIEVRTLKSGKNGMDKKMQEALKADNHPTITYRLTKFVLAKGTKADQDVFDVDTTGELTVAGVKREYRMPMRLKVVDAKHLRISGETKMKMTDFNVKPPQALAGLIKSGDGIKVSFEWNVERAEKKATTE